MASEIAVSRRSRQASIRQFQAAPGGSHGTSFTVGRLAGMMRPAVALVIAAVPSLAVSVPVAADSRLLSIRTDKAGTTIDQALVNGHPIPVAGQAGGLTFFRIDDPVGVISCDQHFVVVASTGERQKVDADLCARNWQLSVHLGGSPAPPPEQDSRPSPIAEASPPDTAVITTPTQPITITTDDPKVGIESVMLDGQPMPLGNRDEKGIAISVAGGPGRIPCVRDLRLRLSDGRSIERKINICDHNWSVLARLADADPPATDRAAPPQSPGVPAPAGHSEPPSVASASPVAAAPSAPASAPPAEASSPNALPAAATPLPTPPAPNTGEVWSLGSGAGWVTVGYGIPRAMPRFAAGCQPGSGGVAVRVFQPLAPGDIGEPPVVTLRAGDVERKYPAVHATIPEGAEGSRLEFWTSSADLLWQGLMNQPGLEVQVGKAPSSFVSLQGGAEHLQRFLGACTGLGAPKVAATAPPVAEETAAAPPRLQILRYGKWRIIVRGGRFRHEGDD